MLELIITGFMVVYCICGLLFALTFVDLFMVDCWFALCWCFRLLLLFVWFSSNVCLCFGLRVVGLSYFCCVFE